ncbi:746_t:CDS:2 [Diversispora eburnea]|uniref:746_t:CDS:1 n=1 Tax=Diversispora eburnea TaxID=1213867 RepID=A0A9N9BY87_9GLOM|nr:746_t:CDS:2 [Diversispora eburnea]
MKTRKKTLQKSLEEELNTCKNYSREERKRRALEISWKYCNFNNFQEDSFKLVSIFSGCSIEEIKEFYSAKRNCQSRSIEQNKEISYIQTIERKFDESSKSSNLYDDDDDHSLNQKLEKLEKSDTTYQDLVSELFDYSDLSSLPDIPDSDSDNNLELINLDDSDDLSIDNYDNKITEISRKDADSALPKSDSHSFKRPRILKSSENVGNVSSYSELIDDETDPLPDMIRSETESIPSISEVQQTDSEISNDLCQNESTINRDILINSMETNHVDFTLEQKTLDFYRSENDCVTVNSNFYKNESNLDVYDQVVSACKKIAPKIGDKMELIEGKCHSEIETIVNSEINFDYFDDNSSQTKSWIDETTESDTTDNFTDEDLSNTVNLEEEYRRLTEAYEYGFPHLYTYLQDESCISGSQESCRFQRFRIFEQLTPETIGPNYNFRSSDQSLPTYSYKTNQFRPPDEEVYVLTSIAPTLKEILIKEVRHLKRRTVCRILESGVRHLCDHCNTTVFAGYWMCSCCGTEICLECYEEWINSKNYKCKIVDRKHKKYSFFPISRFSLSEIEGLLNDINEHIHKNSENIMEKRRSQVTQNRWSDGKMSIKEFRQMYKLGKPFVISSVYDNLTENLWTPKYFEKHFGHISCTCINLNEQDEQKSHSVIKVGEFFNGFNKVKSLNSSGRIPCLKLKDWPPNEDFAKVFPEHYKDFMLSLPFKRYICRDGALNLVSRLPNDTNPPDLGPKMYNAYGSSDKGGRGKGTTNLHLDMTDAVNVMTYATPFFQRSKHEQNYKHAAVWDMYHIEDLPKICAFLQKVAKEQKIIINHPIHDQCFYLNEKLRKRLKKEYGITGWRIYQNPGDVVFIPAGCAHQVCNYTSCIKVALDFVSPEGVARSQIITGQFRKLEPNHERKEDILQLSNILYHTWITAYRNVNINENDDENNENSENDVNDESNENIRNSEDNENIGNSEDSENIGNSEDNENIGNSEDNGKNRIFEIIKSWF